MSTIHIIQALSGGAIIGLASAMVLLLQGRVAGISGMVADVLRPRAGQWGWRASFLCGLILGGLVWGSLEPSWFSASPRSLPMLAAAGALVGFGTRLGSGCTSGHGVCGLGLGSLRSLVATLTFIATGVLTVLVSRWLSEG